MRTVTVSWIAPTQRTDNSALSTAQISRFAIYASLNAGAYDFIGQVTEGSATSFTTEPLPEGVYNFKVTAVDTNDQESVLSGGSNAVTVPADLPAPPKAPSNVGAVLN
jgi:hypothetical protein